MRSAARRLASAWPGAPPSKLTSALATSISARTTAQEVGETSSIASSASWGRRGTGRAGRAAWLAAEVSRSANQVGRLDQVRAHQPGEGVLAAVTGRVKQTVLVGHRFGSHKATSPATGL